MARTSPASPTSPSTTVPSGTGLSRKLEAIAETMAISTAGSITLTPPATFMKISYPIRCMPSCFSITAASKATRLGSNPRMVRRGVPKLVLLARACSSTRIGRVPSILAVTVEPGAFAGRSDKKTAEGLATSSRPWSFISKTPISLVEPNLFLTARRIRKI